MAAEMLIVVAAALIDTAGKVLVQRRPSGKPMAGLWEFPGGKTELGEAPGVALVREVEEELGIEVAAEALEPIGFSADPQGVMLLLLFGARRWIGSPCARAADALAWVAPESLDATAMPPADGPLIQAVKRYAGGSA